MKASVPAAPPPNVGPLVIDGLKQLGRQLDSDPDFVRRMASRLDVVLQTNPAKHDH